MAGDFSVNAKSICCCVVVFVVVVVVVVMVVIVVIVVVVGANVGIVGKDGKGGRVGFVITMLFDVFTFLFTKILITWIYSKG